MQKKEDLYIQHDCDYFGIKSAEEYGLCYATRIVYHTILNEYDEEILDKKLKNTIGARLRRYKGALDSIVQLAIVNLGKDYATFIEEQFDLGNFFAGFKDVEEDKDAKADDEESSEEENNVRLLDIASTILHNMLEAFNIDVDAEKFIGTFLDKTEEYMAVINGEVKNRAELANAREMLLKMFAARGWDLSRVKSNKLDKALSLATLFFISKQEAIDNQDKPSVVEELERQILESEQQLGKLGADFDERQFEDTTALIEFMLPMLQKKVLQKIKESSSDSEHLISLYEALQRGSDDADKAADEINDMLEEIDNEIEEYSTSMQDKLDDILVGDEGVVGWGYSEDEINIISKMVPDKKFDKIDKIDQQTRITKILAKGFSDYVAKGGDADAWLALPTSSKGPFSGKKQIQLTPEEIQLFQNVFKVNPAGGSIKFNFFDMAREVGDALFTKTYEEGMYDDDEKEDSIASDESIEIKKKKKKQAKSLREQNKNQVWVNLGAKWWDEWIAGQQAAFDSEDRQRLLDHYVLIQDKILSLIKDPSKCGDCDEFVLTPEQYNESAKWFMEVAYEALIEWIELHSDHEYGETRQQAKERKAREMERERQQKAEKKLKEAEKELNSWLSRTPKEALRHEKFRPGTIDKLIASLYAMKEKLGGINQIEAQMRAQIDAEEARGADLAQIEKMREKLRKKISRQFADDYTEGEDEPVEEPEEDDYLGEQYKKSLKSEKSQAKTKAPTVAAPAATAATVAKILKACPTVKDCTLDQVKEHCKARGLKTSWKNKDEAYAKCVAPFL